MRGLRDRMLGMPIIYKVLIANTAIVVLGALGGTCGRASPALRCSSRGVSMSYLQAEATRAAARFRRLCGCARSE